jgi:acyl dehydratase
MSLRKQDVRIPYNERDTMLYALSVGMGRDPLDMRELEYVYEGQTLRTLPSQAYVVARSALLQDSGLNRTKILHGEQGIVMYQPLPPAGTLLTNSWVDAVYDKGPDKGLVVIVQTDACEESTGQQLFSATTTIFARGDGGIGGSSSPAPQPHALPQRAPDMTRIAHTRPEQALYYRLTGDRNPLHAEPAVALRAGFKAPILHGMCTYGIACKEIVSQACGYDHTRIEEFQARFTSPVYPGEDIQTDLWIDGSTVSFRCSVPARDVVVMSNGRCKLRAPQQK